MKKLLVLLTLFAGSVNIYAQSLTATLQQGDSVSVFFGIYAFRDACKSASDGAVITLSAGQFQGGHSIYKSITVYGIYAFGSKDSQNTVINGTPHILADSVHFEGIKFYDINLGGNSLGWKEITNFHIKRCWIERQFTAYCTHYNTLVDQCVVKTDKAIENGVNYKIQNSTLGKFGAMNTSANIAKITNCVVWEWVYGKNNTDYYKQPYAIYINNILGDGNNANYTYTTSTNSEFYHNLFINTAGVYGNIIFTVVFPSGIDGGNISGVEYGEYYKSGSLRQYPAAKPYNGATLGMDGTWIGTYGGTGFKDYPGIPRIISSSIDSYTDAEGKLNVKIKARAEQ